MTGCAFANTRQNHVFLCAVTQTDTAKRDRCDHMPLTDKSLPAGGGTDKEPPLCLAADLQLVVGGGFRERRTAG